MLKGSKSSIPPNRSRFEEENEEDDENDGGNNDEEEEKDEDPKCPKLWAISSPSSAPSPPSSVPS
jgi:hypothetical protein